MANVRAALQSRILDGMIHRVGGTSWKVLVVDRAALRILAAGVRLNSLAKEGVTVVEMLDLRREPLPQIPAVYFVTPTPETVQLLMAEGKRQYKEFHVFFTRRVPDFQMQIIKKCGAFLRKVKTFVELDVEFLALESAAFSLDRPAGSIPQIFGGDRKDRAEETKILSERLAEVCKLVGPEVDWTVRYDALSMASRTVASLVKELLETARIEKRTHANGAVGEESQQKATLLVVDRATDLISPLLHEFTYQAMAHDLLDLDYSKPGGAHYGMRKDGKEEPGDGVQGNEKKKIPLEDEDGDDLWKRVRHMHIEEARGIVNTALREFVEKDPAARVHGSRTGDGGPLDIKDLSAAVRALPGYKETLAKHDLHVSAILDCLSHFRQRNLEQVASVEQDLAIGRDAEGVKVKADKMLDRLEWFLGNCKAEVRDKARVVMLATAVGESTVALGGEVSLLSASNSYKRQLNPGGAVLLAHMTPPMKAALQGLQIVIQETNSDAEEVARREKGSMVGSSTEEDSSRSLRRLLKIKDKYKERRAAKKRELARRKRHGLDDDELPYALSRYIPPLRSVALDLISGELKESSFPEYGGVSVDAILASLGSSNAPARGPPSFDSRSTHSFNQSQSSDSVESSSGSLHRMADPNHMYIIFIVGGVCYSEVRAIYEVRNKRKANIIVGGSQILTPQMFTKALAAVADPTIRLEVMMPPFPIEVAQIMAARGKGTKVGSKASKSVEVRESDKQDPTMMSEGGEDYVIVAGYEKKSIKKSFGGLFGRKKK